MTTAPFRYHVPAADRPRVAATIREYRRFIADHPDDELTPELAAIVRDLHLALHDRRARNRQIGFERRA